MGAKKYINVTKLENDLTEIANILREQTNSNNLLSFPNDYNEKLENLYCAADFASLNYPVGEIYYEGTSILGDQFYGHKNLTSLILPNVTSIPASFCRECSDLMSISANKATSIKNYAFSYDKKLTTINFPKVTSTGLNSFSNCTALTSIDFPSVTSLGQSSFDSCTGLTTVQMDKLLTIATQAFYKCSNITTFVFPKVHTVSGSLCLAQCTKLTTVDLGGKSSNNTATISNSNVFNGNTKLSTLILRSDVVWTLSYPEIFWTSTGTLFASGKTGGTIYVPQSLITSYQQDTNWSQVLAQNSNNQILSIEGSYYETHYADGRLIETEVSA